MDKYGYPTWTRREMLGRVGAVAGAGLIGFGATAAMAEPPPETTTVRLQYDHNYPGLCLGPLLLAEEFLRLEGFIDIKYEGYGNASTEPEVLAEGRADIAASWASDLIVSIDKGLPVVALAGLHAGCIEIFANEQVKSIRDLAGKRFLAGKSGVFDHLFLSGLLTFVGLDPDRDVEWIWKSGGRNRIDLFEQGNGDVLLLSPPMTYMLHEMQIGRVILNTTTDDPWRNFICCMVSGREEFVRRYPIATKRALRALMKANLLCEVDRKGSAKRLVELGATDRQDFAHRVVNQVPFGAWRDYDPAAALRFYSLRLWEAGLIKRRPSDILKEGADFRILEELRQELKT